MLLLYCIINYSNVSKTFYIIIQFDGHKKIIKCLEFCNLKKIILNYIRLTSKTPRLVLYSTDNMFVYFTRKQCEIIIVVYVNNNDNISSIRDRF